MADFRYFQVRDFVSGYSVVFNMDLETGTVLYEHGEHIDLGYNEALLIANEYESKYSEIIREITKKGNWGDLPIDIEEWQKIS